MRENLKKGQEKEDDDESTGFSKSPRHQVNQERLLFNYLG